MIKTKRAERVFIVEDEYLIALLLEELLPELGHQVAEIATRIEQALAIARGGDFDFAILDINVAGQTSFPVADVLRERAIPFIFATGYGSRGLVDGYQNEIAIQKPFVTRDLDRSIVESMARGR